MKYPLRVRARLENAPKEREHPALCFAAVGQTAHLQESVRHLVEDMQLVRDRSALKGLGKRTRLGEKVVGCAADDEGRRHRARGSAPRASLSAGN